ncbi:MAG: hypothetical protein WCD57_15000, partial [Acidobacteriaceae bacterium]
DRIFPEIPERVFVEATVLVDLARKVAIFEIFRFLQTVVDDPAAVDYSEQFLDPRFCHAGNSSRWELLGRVCAATACSGF